MRRFCKQVLKYLSQIQANELYNAIGGNLQSCVMQFLPEKGDDGKIRQHDLGDF